MLGEALAEGLCLSGAFHSRPEGRHWRCRRPPARSPIALASGDRWPGGDSSAAGGSMLPIFPAASPQILQLVQDLLRHREGREWRVGNVYGEPGSRSLCTLAPPKRVFGTILRLGKAVTRSIWCGPRSTSTCARLSHGLVAGSDLNRAQPQRPHRHRQPEAWSETGSRSLALFLGTSAADRRHARPRPISRIAVSDLMISTGRVLRFAARRARKNPKPTSSSIIPRCCALCVDARTGEQCGIINIYLKSDGSDRLRDNKGKTVTGRAGGAVVMLSGFDEPTMGLILCEGAETGISLCQQEVRPVWACGPAGTLAKFPVLGGIEGLTIAADADAPGQRASAGLAARWRNAGCEVRIVPPEAGDWADRP